MPTATIVKVWKDATSAYVAASVLETSGLVEYNTSTPLLDAQAVPLTMPQLKTSLTAALAAVRNAQQTTPQVIAMSGSLTI
jgi:hypothetical protein